MARKAGNRPATSDLSTGCGRGDQKARKVTDEACRAIVETSLDGIYQVDSKGYFIYVNGALAGLFGYTQDELIDTHFSEMLNETELTRVQVMIQRVLAGEDVRDEVDVRHRDGHEIPVAFGATPLWQSGTIVGLTGILRDITERKQADERVRALRHDLQERSKELSLLYAISALLEEPGITLPEVLGETVQRIPASWQYQEITCARITVDGQQFKTENFTETVWRQAQEIVVEGRVAGSVEVYYLEERTAADEGPFLKEERDLIRAVGRLLGKIIERINAVQQLLESEEQYRLVVENSAQGILVVQDQRIELCNPRLVELTGYSPEELASRPFTDFVHPDDREMVGVYHLKRYRGEEGPDFLHYRLIDKSGDTRWIEANALIVQWKNRPATLGFVSDITERRRAADALERSESTLRMAQAIAHVGSYEWDLATGSLSWSDEMCRICGLDPEDRESIRKFDDGLAFIHPDDVPMISESVRALLNGGVPSPTEYRVLHTEGTTRDVVGNGAVVPSDCGESAKLIGTVQDITETKVAQEALRLSEERYRGVVDNAVDAVYTVSPDGRILSINPAFEAITGWPAADWIGKPFHSIVHPDDLPVVQDLFERAEQQPSTEPQEARILTKSGHWVDMEFAGGPLFQDGELEGFIGIGRDVTERKRSEKALQEAERKFREVLESSLDHVYRLDLRTSTYDYVSPACVEVLGYAAEDFMAMDIQEAFALIHPHDVPLLIDNALRLVSGPEEETRARRLEFRVRHGTKGYRWMGDQRSIVYDEEGAPVAVVGSLRDITERKEAEALLSRYWQQLETTVRQRTEELGRANALLRAEVAERRAAEKNIKRLYHEEKRLRNELEAEMRKRVEFTRALAHELKTPLTPVVASSQLLESRAADDSSRRLARNIARGAANLNKAIDALLDLARSEVGALELNMAPVDILQLIAETLEDQTVVAQNRGVGLTTGMPDALPPVNGDRVRLKQVLINLLDNALKYSSKGACVQMAARHEDSAVVVEVTDTGPGIAKKDQERLFDPYFRLEGDRHKISGLGLGLALCKTVVELHGGQLWVRSRRGKGTTFGFTLPIDKAPEKPSLTPIQE